MDPMVDLTDSTVCSISYPNMLTKGSEEQDDCTIIEPKNQQENSFNCKTYKKNKKIPATTPIILDEDSEKDECTIIDDQFDHEIEHSHLQNNNTTLVAKLIDIKQLQYMRHRRCIASGSEKSQQNSYKTSNIKRHSKVVAEKNSVKAIIIEEDSDKNFCKNSYNYNKNDLLSKDLVKKNYDEAIVIEEDSEKDNDCECVTENKIMHVGNKLQNHASSHRDGVIKFDEICRRDKALANLIEKCLDMENSTGMLRIVNRTLIPIYIDTSEDFKNSIIFQRILTNVLMKLDTEPNRKFLHLKMFCEAMKSRKNYKPSRNTKLAMSDSKLNGKCSRKRKESLARKISSKKKKLIIINLDDDEETVFYTNTEPNDADTKVASQIEPNDSKFETNYTPIGQKIKDIEINNTQIRDNNTNVQMCAVNVESTTTDCQINEIHIQIEDIKSEAVEENSTVQISSVYKNHVQIHSNLNSITSEINEIETNWKEDDDLILIDEEICNSSIDIEKYEETSDHYKCKHVENEINNISKESSSTIKNYDKNVNDTKNFVEGQSDVILIEGVVDKSNKENKMAIPSQYNNIREAPDCDSGELVPLSSETLLQEDEINSIRKLKIEYIEAKIGKLNATIKLLEAKEVDWDYQESTSTYIMCESFKSTLVDLYKELCSLTGMESVKRHEVRLKVQEGHPEGPVRCLEQFINSNIDENGDPPFPDMHDVIKCVEEANTTCNLGWSNKDIIMEARALFIHYGRTVQKKRKKREWRHLMRYVEKEDTTDPADDDPTLQARLVKNSKLAMKNEKDLLDRYAEMEVNNRATLNAGGSPIESYRRIPLTYNVASTSNVAEGHSEAVLYDAVPNNRTEPSNVTGPYTGVITDIITKPSNEIVPNNTSIKLNTYKESCGGHLTDNLHIFNAGSAPNNVVLAPAVVTYPLTIAVDQNIMSVIRVTANEENFSIANENLRETPNYSNTVDSIVLKGNSDEGIDHIDININSDLSNCNAVTDNKEATNVYGNVSIEHNKENANSVVNEEVDVKSYVTGFGGTQSTSIQDNEVSTNFDITATNNDKPETNIEQSEVSSSTEVRKKDFTELSNNASPLNTVKKEPLDINRMLLELGDNFTVSIMDIEDPFEIIEISDSSDSEEEEDVW